MLRETNWQLYIKVLVKPSLHVISQTLVSWERMFTSSSVWGCVSDGICYLLPQLVFISALNIVGLCHEQCLPPTPASHLWHTYSWRPAVARMSTLVYKRFHQLLTNQTIAVLHHHNCRCLPNILHKIEGTSLYICAGHFLTLTLSFGIKMSKTVSVAGLSIQVQFKTF